VLVLHDDVELCDDFMRHAWNAAATHPFEPLSLFCSSPETVQAWDRGYSWLSWADKAWGAALILPARLAKEFVEWCDSHVNEAWKADDTRLALFLAARDRRLLTSVPSLVRHREGPSIAQPQGSTIPTALWLREPARRHGEMRWNGPVQYLDGNPRALLVSRGKWLKGL
jgi:hypothetical protein